MEEYVPDEELEYYDNLITHQEFTDVMEEGEVFVKTTLEINHIEDIIVDITPKMYFVGCGYMYPSFYEDIPWGDIKECISKAREKETGFFRLTVDCDLLLFTMDHWFSGDSVFLRVYYSEAVTGERDVTDEGVYRVCIPAENYAAEMQKVVNARNK